MAACLALAVLSSAHAEQLALGPVDIYLDMSLVPEPYIVAMDPFHEIHPGWLGLINCTVFPAHIGHNRDVQIQLHMLENASAIDLYAIKEVLYSAGLLPAGWSNDSSNISVAGHRGVLVNATGPIGQKAHVAGFSPDGDSGQGCFICLVRSDLRWSCTRALLDSMRVVGYEFQPPAHKNQ